MTVMRIGFLKISTKILCLLMVLFVFGGCSSAREYHDDIHVQLENRQAEAIIREWSYLLGSGAEVYYRDADEETLLGKLLGGDDGFCPFKEGLYSVSVEDNQLTIEWCRLPADKEKAWDKKAFVLPSS